MGKRWGRILASALVLFGAVVPAARAASVGPAGAALSGNALVARLLDPARAADPYPQGFREIRRSSHDRRGANSDAALFDPATEVVGNAADLRAEDGAFVLFDEVGPGCLTRFWVTGISGAEQGGLGGWGRLQFRFDGDEAPSLDVPALDFFSGRVPGFPAPLVGAADVSSGGDYSLVPMCFTRSLDVRAVGTVPGLHFFQIDALKAPAGTPVVPWTRSWRPSAPAAPAPAPPAASASGHAPVALALGGGPGSVSRISFTVRPFTIAVLQALRLQITVDGAGAPQVDVPLADAFGDGLAVRRVAARAFGMDPARATGSFSLPAPFRSSASVRVVGPPSASIAMSAWRGPAVAGSVLRGSHRSERTTIGSDYTVLADGGAGHLAAWVLDATGQPGSSAFASYLEGDARVHVDGSRSPSLYGTGTEDEFSAGFYYANGAFTLPTHGAGALLKAGDRSSQSQYRVWGGDGPIWSDGIVFGMEHGASDEAVTTAANTVFWYSYGRSRVARTDVVRSFRGATSSASLASFFEGDHDGTLPVPFVPLGLHEGPALPPRLSPEGFSASGIIFSSPVSFTASFGGANCGAYLRRLFDAGVTSSVAVSVDGRPAGTWSVTERNPFQRWREEDFELPASLVARGGPHAVTLAPAGGPATIYRLEAFTRCA